MCKKEEGDLKDCDGVSLDEDGNPVADMEFIQKGGSSKEKNKLFNPNIRAKMREIISKVLKNNK